MKGTLKEARRSSESALESMPEILRTKAPYVPTGLCSLSLLITGTEPASSLLPSAQDFRFTLTDLEIYAEMKIDPKLFLSSECDLGKLNGLFREFFSREKGCLDVLEGIERELSIISTLEITEIHRRVIEEFLREFKPVVETQKKFYRNMAVHQATIPLNGIEDDKAAAALFLALYDTNGFKEHIKALRRLVDYWAIMDALLIEYRKYCEKIEQRLPIIAADCRYAFGARVVQIVSRREMLARELLKSLNLTDSNQIQCLLQCYKAIAYVPTCDNLLLSFKQDGYLRPSKLPWLLDTYFNPKQSNTLIHFLIQSQNQDSVNAFLNFVAQQDAYSRLQFFRDIYALFEKKPLYVTDLQLLAPYFSDDNPLNLKLKPELLIPIQKALYDDNPNTVIKMKQIVSTLIPAIEEVSSDLNEMLKAFLAAPSLIPELSGMSFEPAVKVLLPALRSEAAIEMRNDVVTALFKREVEKQITLLQATDIFHDICFENLGVSICREILDPLLRSEEDELRFLVRYAKALLEIPYYLMSALPKNFTKESIDKQAILSYNFCAELNPGETALNLRSLTECLSRIRAAYKAKNRDFLAAVEKSASVFDLFNRVKDHSNYTIYTTLKEDIRSLNCVNPKVFDRNQKGVVAKTPALFSRLDTNRKPIANSWLPTPFYTPTGKTNEKLPPDSGTPLYTVKSTSGIDFKKLVAELDKVAKTERLELKKYIQSDVNKKKFCTKDEKENCNYVEARKSEKLLLTAQSSDKDSSVTVHCHEEHLVAKTVAAMAKSISMRDTVATLEININVSNEKEKQSLIQQYVTQAINQNLFPKVIVNGIDLKPGELCDKLDKLLAQKYDEIKDEVKQGNFSKNRMGHFATRSNDKQSTARKRLFQDLTDRKSVILS